MSFTLRDYQEDLLAEVRRSLGRVRSVVVQAPTGSGKSVLIAEMIRRSAERGLSSWLVCHRRELLDQLSATLHEAGVPHGQILSGRPETDARVQVASIQTLVRRLDRYRPPNLLALDECHHARSTTWQQVVEHCDGSWIVGLSATPMRLDGHGLDHLFDDLVVGPSVRELIDRGYLAPYRVFAPPSGVDLSGVRNRAGDWARGELADVMDTKKIVGNAVEHYLSLVAAGDNGSGPPTCLVYCVNRLHARHVEAAYRAAGVDARYCAGDTPTAEREEIIKGLLYGEPPVVVSVDLFGEGLDCPGLQAVQLLRPTQSLGLYLQQVGRCLRPERGKNQALILDHVGNVMRHGLPAEERVWTLEGTRGEGAPGDGGPALRTCEECFAVFDRSEGACPLCGWEPEPNEAAVPDEVDGELEEIDEEALRQRRRREEREAHGIEALVRLALQRGYRFGWASYRHAARTNMPVYAAKEQERQIRRQIKQQTY